MREKIKQKGFSLVELLIYMGLMSFMLLILTDIFVSVLDVRRESESFSAVEQDGSFIMSRLVYDVNRANSIPTPSSLGQSTTSLVTEIDGRENTYLVDNGRLMLNNDLGSNNLNSSTTQVSSLSFQKIGNVNGKETIVIGLTLNSTTQRSSGPESKSFQTTASLRWN